MRIRKLHHAQIGIPKGAEEQAREFYCGLMGLRELPKPDSLRAKGGLWLELGGNQIHVSVEDGVDRWASKAHLAYQVEDLDGWRRELEAKGFRTEPGTPVQGMERCELRDPFGNRIELLELRG